MFLQPAAPKQSAGPTSSRVCWPECFHVDNTCVEGQTTNVCLHQNTKNMDNKRVRNWLLHPSHAGPERLFLFLGVTGSSECFCQRASVTSSEGPPYLLQGGTVQGRSCPSLCAFIRRRAAVFRVWPRKSEEEAWGETLVLLLFVTRHTGGRDHNEADFCLRSICQDAPLWESKEESLSCCACRWFGIFYFICKEMNLKVASMSFSCLKVFKSSQKIHYYSYECRDMYVLCVILSCVYLRQSYCISDGKQTHFSEFITHLCWASEPFYRKAWARYFHAIISCVQLKMSFITSGRASVPKPVKIPLRQPNKKREFYSERSICCLV